MNDKTISNSLTNLRVLLVDDLDSTRIVIKNLLRRFMMRIDTASNGIEALERLRENDYDIILMDLAMPEMDGIEATKIIRNEFPYPKKDTPVIALTASLFQEAEFRIYSAGMNACVGKPVVRKELINAIEKLTDSEFRNVSRIEISPPNRKYPIDEQLDLSYLYEVSEGDDRFAAELIESFLRRTPLIIAEIRINLKREDIKKCRELCHKLKPTLSYMGLLKITPVFLKFHETLQKDKIDYHREVLTLDELEELLKVAVVKLQKIKENLLMNGK